MSDVNSNPPEGEVTLDDFATSLLMPDPDGATEEKEVDAAPDAEVVETEEVEAEEVETEEVEAAGDEETAEQDEAEEEPGEEVDPDEDNDAPTPGELRQADYTRKTQQLARDRDALEAKARQLAETEQQMRAFYQQKLAEVAQPTEQEPDWVELAKSDPFGYLEKKAEWDAGQAKRQRAQAEHQAMMMQEHNQRLEQGRAELLRHIPEWNDPEKYKADSQRLVAVGQGDYGFTSEEMSSLVDPRMVRVLKDAAAYRALQKSKPKTVKKVVKAKKVLKPGASTTSAEKKAERARSVGDRLKKTGSMEDFAEWMLDPK